MHLEMHQEEKNSNHGQNYINKDDFIKFKIKYMNRLQDLYLMKKVTRQQFHKYFRVSTNW